MFCFIVKKKLYDFVDGSLDKETTKKIEVHLKKCTKCAQEYRQTQKVLTLARQKKAPQHSPEFWMNFDRELDEKLAKIRVLPQKVKLQPGYIPHISLKAALATVVVFVLIIGVSFYLFGGLPTKGRLMAWADERLINDIETLEDLTGESVILDDQDSLLDELNFLEELS